MSACTCKTCPVHVKTVACGACGAPVPRVITKAQARLDSPEMKARIKHITEECPARTGDSNEGRNSRSAGEITNREGNG